MLSKMNRKWDSSFSSLKENLVEYILLWQQKHDAYNVGLIWIYLYIKLEEWKARLVEMHPELKNLKIFPGSISNTLNQNNISKVKIHGEAKEFIDD